MAERDVRSNMEEWKSSTMLTGTTGYSLQTQDVSIDQQRRVSCTLRIGWRYADSRRSRNQPPCVLHPDIDGNIALFDGSMRFGDGVDERQATDRQTPWLPETRFVGL